MPDLKRSSQTNPFDSPSALHKYWFASSYDGGATWQLTDGPFTEAEAQKVKGTVDRPWIIVCVESLEGASMPAIKDPVMPYLPTVPNGFREWGSIEFPQWLRDLGFEDRSYHNDLCARAELQLTSEEFPLICVWVEHEKAEDREEPDGARFFAHVATTKLEYEVTENEWVDDPDVGNRLYQGDSAADCEAAIRQCIAVLAMPHTQEAK